MLKLRWLRIGKYRIVKPGTELRFNDGYNILLGRNGTGKTTLLNLIAMIFSSSFAGLEEEEFDIEYEFAVPQGTFRVHVRNQRAKSYNYSVRLDFTISNSVVCRVDADRAKIKLSISKNGDIPVVYASSEDPSPFQNNSFVRRILDSCRMVLEDCSDDEDEYDNHGIIVAIGELEADLQQQESYQRFDESIDWLKESIEHARISVVISGDASGTHSKNRIPIELEEALLLIISQRPSEAGEPSVKTEVLSFDSNKLRFLDRTVQALGYQESTLHIELLDSSPWPGVDIRIGQLGSFGKLRFYFTKRDGARLALESLSFGQKRLVAFFYYLATHPSVLIADELANGMHHAMIADCLAAAGDRQKFLATQNPLLLDHLDFHSSEEVRATFVRCECSTEGPREQMVWSPLTEEEAHDLYEDYRIEIQHTSEILRMRGLW